MQLHTCHTLFYLFVAIFFILGDVTESFRNASKGKIISYIAIGILSLVVGLRDLDAGSDTAAYYSNFQRYQHDLNDISFAFGSDPVFYTVSSMIAHTTGSYSLFLAIISFTTNILIYRFSSKLCRNIGDTKVLLLFLSIISTFCCFNMETNTIRNGLAMSLLINGLLSIFTHNKISGIVYGLLAVFTHFSSAIFLVIAYCIKYSNYNLKLYYLIFLIALVLSIVGYSILDFGVLDQFNLKAINTYTNVYGEDDYKVGFRWSFALYNTFFSAIYFIKKGQLKNIFESFLKYYLLTSALFFLWFTIPFSDRIGIYSWIIIPIIVMAVLSTDIKNTIRPLEYSFILLFVLNYCLSLMHV